MSEKELTEEQREKLEALKREWLEEAEPYLVERKNRNKNICILDGSDSKALFQLQIKYKEKIQKVLNNEE